MNIFWKKQLFKCVIIINSFIICHSEIKLCFDPVQEEYKYFSGFYPTENDITAPDEDKNYNIPAEMFTRKPILAFICNENNEALDLPHPLLPEHGMKFFISSITASNMQDNYEGTLCHYYVNEPTLTPIRNSNDLQYQELICGSTNHEKSLPAVEVLSNKLIVKHLMHTLPDYNGRKYRLTLIINETYILTLDTEKFYITDAIYKVQWDKPSLENIVANQPFSISLSIIYKNGSIVRTGFGSTFYVLVCIAYKDKYFYSNGTKQGLLYNTKATLSGQEVRISKENGDNVLMKRAKKGRVTFQDVRILETTKNTLNNYQLNATLVVPDSSFTRYPYNFSDYEKCHELKMLEDDSSQQREQNPVYLYSYLNDCKEDLLSSLTDTFTVEVQLADSLYVEEYFQDQMEVTAHFPVIGIQFWVLDDLKNLIYDGHDSTLPIEITSDPEGIQFSKDNQKYLQQGKGSFRGSVMKTSEKGTGLKLCFQVTSFIVMKKLLKGCTKNKIIVTGEIHLAVFGRLSLSGGGSQTDPLIEAFARFAAEDINNKIGQTILPELPVLPDNLTLIITGYDTKYDVQAAAIAFTQAMTLGKYSYSKKIRSLIGFSSDEITSNMVAFTRKNKIPVIALKEMSTEYIKAENFFKFTWNEKEVFGMLREVFFQRNWNTFVTVRFDSSNITELFIEMKKKNIEIDLDVTFPQFSESKKIETYFIDELIPNKLEQIRNTGIKIIFLYLPAPIQYYIFRAAIRLGIDCQHGYQWVTIEHLGMDFPFNNNHPVCVEKPTCTEGMECMLIFTSAYYFDYKSKLWQHVHRKFFEADRTLYRAVPKAKEFYLTSEYVEGYDAVLAFTHAVVNIIHEENTVTTAELLKKLYKSEFQGLTGRVDYKKFEMQQNYQGAIISVHNDPAHEETKNFLLAQQISRFIFFHENDGLIELLVQANDHMKKHHDAIIGEVTLPKSDYYNKRLFKSYRGGIDTITQQITHIENVTKYPIVSKDIHHKRSVFSTSDVVLREEKIIQAYNCKAGCGGAILNEYDGNNYTNGICIKPNRCKCKTVKELYEDVPEEFWSNRPYSGKTCEDPICQECKNGICVGPQICLCKKGYMGHNCLQAFCSGGCGPGKCVTPEVCECPGGYVGQNCEITLSVILGALFACLILLVLCCLNIACHWYQKRQKIKYISTVNWLVKWDEVALFIKRPSLGTVITSPVMGIPHPAYSVPDGKIGNVVLWHRLQCYAQKYRAESLDPSSPTLREEIINMIQLRHPNIIIFVGICLEAPHVAILTPYIPKGSLEDVLSSRKLPLDWDVKFSILKDIAKGMEYIHNSPIGSHGQLKSSNCLMDNRWYIRISGFGVPTVRNHPYQKPSQSKDDALLWTAPELLRIHNSLNEVIPGTKAGDIYSFAIIISEVCTEDLPYMLERQYLSSSEIIMLLKYPLDPANRGLKRVWDSLLRKPQDEFIRPLVSPENLPVYSNESSGLQKLMHSCWHETPTTRPDFTTIIRNLYSVKPMKGELVDLLITRLEDYSMKLEEKFVEASQELQMEKMRIEELLGRMLPKKIVEDMIHGKRIDAEEFESVTLAFSDIADFLYLSSFATPFEIIELLNNLYICFDSIIDNYDVYKVETVRDEYMVVSGLPTRNGYQHASEISTLSLNLMSAILGFEIPFQAPDKLLMLRIGIHSGPCVAGVVGLHMPRYCLFGDTVNTASRMKSGSVALRIHMSESTYNILKILGGYITELRGIQVVKGKGKMLTYWLNGKEGFMQPLPDASQAVSREKQEFK